MTLANEVQDVEQHRGRLFGIAYRMLGQVQEAEDLVQEAYLRWHQAAQDGIDSPLAWLIAVITRLSIDRLRRAAVERTTYVGEWLPEPIATGTQWAADHALGQRGDLSLAFLVLLERLAPDERAAFLLRDVFDEDYAVIADALDKSESAVRQIVHRARTRVRSDRARFPVEPARTRRMLDRFLAAIAAADRDALLATLADDATFTSDGGGKVTAAINVISGAERVVRLLIGLEEKWVGRFRDEIAEINGEPAIVTYADGGLFAATTFVIEDDHIKAVYRVMNPEKLRFVAGTAGATGAAGSAGSAGA